MALLEVVVALGLFLTALAMIGTAFSNSDRNARWAVQRSRALMLTEQVITYFDTGQFQEEREASGYFGTEGPPGWAWSIKAVTDSNVPGLLRVTVRIVEGDPDGGSESTRVILATDFLRAEKKNLNLEEDLGLSKDQVQQLSEAIPGGAAVLDPTNFDPTSLARLDMDTLTELLPLIMQSLATMQAGGAAGGLPPGVDADKVLDALGSAGTGGGSAGGSGGQSAVGPGALGGATGGSGPSTTGRRPTSGTGRGGGGPAR